MSIDPQRHVHRAVSRQVLDFLDVQTGLEHAGYMRVPQDVGGDKCSLSEHAANDQLFYPDCDLV